ncbi:MAG: amino acid permease [Bacteroidota bacterium]
MVNKKLGLWASTSLVAGNMIGSGIFLLPASLAAFGGISVIGWLISAMGALMLARIFGYLSRKLPQVSGGPYAYTQHSLGEFPGFWVAWGYWISIWSTNAAIAVALVGYVSVFYPPIAERPEWSISTGLVCVWFLTWVNTRPIRVVGRVQLISTLLKILPILAIGIWGIFYIDPHHFTPFNRSDNSHFSAILTTTMLTLFAFLGMESATVPSASVKNPARTIPRATLIGTLLATFVYILGSTAVMGILPPEKLAQSRAPFADAAALFWGNTFATYLVALGGIIATFGALNGWILIQGQIPMVAAQDQLFPQIFSKKNKHGAPAWGIFLSSILVSLLMSLNYSKSLVGAFTFMMTLSTLSVITPYVFSTASFALLSFRETRSVQSPNLLLALCCFVFLVGIIIGCGQEVVFWGFVLLVLGIPFYVGMKRVEG